MNFQEILKARGLDEGTIKGISEDMKANQIFTTTHENMDVRYPKLKTEHDALVAQHGESTKLIDQLKADAKGSEAMQGKITAYESKLAELEKQNTELRIDSAAKIALLSANVTDVAYMMFCLKEKGDLELDDQDNIKGIDDRIAGLKTQFPTFFASAESQRELQPQRLPDRNAGSGENTVTKEEFNKMGYKSRVELKESNPELYEKLK